MQQNFTTTCTQKHWNAFNTMVIFLNVGNHIKMRDLHHGRKKFALLVDNKATAESSDEASQLKDCGHKACLFLREMQLKQSTKQESNKAQ